MRLTIAGAVLAFVVAAPSGGSASDFDWTSYPEMSRERALPQIAASLRNSLFDAGSVTNFMICYPPVKVKMRDGKPVRWTLLLSVNAKNQYGGYAGNQGMAAVFYSDRPVWTFSIGGPLDTKTSAGCARVPDVEIQQLIHAQ